MSDLKNRLLQWEATPRKEVWEKIESSLHTDDEYLLSQKLFHFQQPPGDGVWEKIEPELTEAAKAPVISLYQRYRLPIKYGSAAAALILLAVLVSLFVTSKNISAPSDSLPLFVQKNQPPDLPAKNGDSNKNSNRTAYQPVVREAASSLTTRTYNHFPQLKKWFTRLPYLKAPVSGEEEWFEVFISEREPIVNNRTLDRYIIHTKNTGDAVKLSKKLYILFRCSDKWSEEKCTEYIRLLQDKAATSAMYASADFTGVLELLRNFQENQ